MPHLGYDATSNNNFGEIFRWVLLTRLAGVSDHQGDRTEEPRESPHGASPWSGHAPVDPDEAELEAAAASYFGPRFLARLHARMHSNPVTGLLTKAVVTVVGTAVMFAGVVMMVTPGPGIVALLLGLAILSTEWRWADRLLDTARERAKEAAEKARTMDPAVRRRRVLVGLLACLAVLLLASALVAALGWPPYTEQIWDRAQNFVGWLPELPGSTS